MRSDLFKMTRTRFIIDCVLALILLGIFGVFADVLWMPGTSYHGPTLPLTAEERLIEANLRREIEVLATDVGERNYTKYERLNQACAHIEDVLKASGYKVREQKYELDGFVCKNVEAELVGFECPADVIIVGAHYDSVTGCPGANDNGSGMATVLEFARLLAHTHPKCTIRFVLFTNEEPPYVGGNEMGSYRYVQELKTRNERVIAMLDMETLNQRLRYRYAT